MFWLAPFKEKRYETIGNKFCKLFSSLYAKDLPISFDLMYMYIVVDLTDFYCFCGIFSIN